MMKGKNLPASHSEKTMRTKGIANVIAKRVPTLFAFNVAFTFLAILSAPKPVRALEYQGRIDTRYQLQVGDNSTDNDVFQYHFFELSFLKYMTFQWNGGVRKDLDGKINEVTPDGKEKTDIAFRGLPDAANKDQTWEYRIYTAYLMYKQEQFGALVGRCNPYEYEFSQFDGIMLWASPFQWLKVEGFGGKPWHYGYVSNLNYYWGEGELILGLGTDFIINQDKSKLSLRYLFLREKTQLDTLIGEASDTYLSSDHLLKARMTYAFSPSLNTGLILSFLNTNPRNLQTWASGTFDRFLVAYSFNYSMQFIDISDISDRLTQYSAFLTSSHPYFSVSGDVTKNFSNIFKPNGFFDDIELELSY
jgi:hypothetical protein